MTMLHNPGLPAGRVTSLAMGALYRERLEKSLKALEIKAFWLSDNPCADPRLRGHADLMLCNPVRGTVVLENHAAAANPYFLTFIQRIGGSVVMAEGEQGPIYPADAMLNVCTMGNMLVLNPRTADPAIRKLISEKTVLAVRQGYTNCALCPISANAVITGDGGIGKVCRQAGLDVLQLDERFVRLPGFAHGFFGGGTFLIAENKLALTGRIEDPLAARQVEIFLEKHGLEAVYLTDEPLFDIGGAILLEEEFNCE